MIPGLIVAAPASGSGKTTVTLGLLELMGEPLLSATLIMPGESEPLNDPEDIVERLGKRVDVVLDAGYGGLVPTTVIEFGEDGPQVLRTGLGDPADFR